VTVKQKTQMANVLAGAFILFVIAMIVLFVWALLFGF
jgi:hypothetical protein